MTPEEKYHKLKVGMYVVGKKGCGRVTVFGPKFLIYEYEYQREKRVIKEPLEDVWFDSMDDKLPPGWSGEVLREKEVDDGE